MILFTKKHCSKCDYIKEAVDIEALGIEEQVLSEDNPESLSLLAWHELVQVAETLLPILVIDDATTITGAIKIKNYLTSL